MNEDNNAKMLSFCNIPNPVPHQETPAIPTMQVIKARKSVLNPVNIGFIVK